MQDTTELFLPVDKIIVEEMEESSNHSRVLEDKPWLEERINSSQGLEEQHRLEKNLTLPKGWKANGEMQGKTTQE